MKRNNYKRRIFLKRAASLVLSVALAVSFTGCGKEQINYDVENQGQSEENGSVSADDATAAKLKEALELDADTWEANFPSNDGLYNNIIKASITVPETSYMSVLELEKKTITNEERKRIVESLFDADTIYAESEEDMPEWYIDSVIPDLETSITYYEMLKNAEDHVWSEQEEDSYQNCLARLELAQTLKNDAPGIGVKTSDYSEYLYCGDINGQHYTIVFSDNGFDCNAIDESTMVSESLLEDGTLYHIVGGTESAGNQCTESAEELERQVRDMLASCGFDEYSINATNMLHWVNYNEEEDNEWDDGYSYIYARTVNGIAVDYTNYDDIGYDYYYSVHSDFNLPADVGDEQEYITVQMNAQGLVSITVPCLYEVKEMLTEQANLLSFSKVKEVMQSMLEADSNAYGIQSEGHISGAESMIYTKLDLLYMRIAGEEGTYALLPVWRLSGWENDRIARMICINAIDGGEINILDDLYKVFDSADEGE